MNNDPFTTAALDSAANKYTSDWDAFQQEPIDDWGFAKAERRAFVAGAVWARTHLAAQEPTDAEVLAALNAQGVAVSPKMHPAPSLDYWGGKPADAMRAALSAARAARRDEEGTP